MVHLRGPHFWKSAWDEIPPRPYWCKQLESLEGEIQTQVAQEERYVEIDAGASQCVWSETKQQTLPARQQKLGGRRGADGH